MIICSSQNSIWCIDNALNGGTPLTFDLGFIPDDFLISSANPHNLFVNDLQGDRRVWVLAYDGMPGATLFSGPVNPNPGGIVGFSRCIALHPGTGDLYVLCEGYYNGGSQPEWISRIQRFKATGTYDNLLIDNQLGIPSDDPRFDKSGGTGAAPDPGFVVRAALGNCLVMGYVTWAAHLGVPIETIEVEIHADFDARGQHGVDGIPAGFSEIRYHVRIESPAPEADVRKVVDAADHASMVGDVYRRAHTLVRHLTVVAPK